MVESSGPKELLSALSLERGPVKLQNAGLDERAGEIFAHGWLDIESAGRLLVDVQYQREVLAPSGGKRSKLVKALEEGARFPDIMVGMRGEDYDTKGHAMILADKCYIVDGLQRVSAIKQFAELHPDKAKDIRIGAEVRFNTTRETERELFLELNTSRIAVSANVILRNMRGTKNPGITALYGLSNADANFPLYGRVTWSQRAARGDLMTAMILSRSALALMGWAAGMSGETATGSARISGSLNSIVAEIGMPSFRKNVTEFFNVVDECWGLRKVEYTQASPHLRGNFLTALATTLARHTNFWKDDLLFLDAPTKRKLAAFPIQDPEIARLASAGSMTKPLLINYLTDHLNKGRKLNRLHKRLSDNDEE